MSLNNVLECVWSDPRLIATLEWDREFSISAQLNAQVPRHEMVQFVEGGGWENPDREVSLVVHEPPDWDWWEPTSEWRRKDARARKFGVEGEAQ